MNSWIQLLLQNTKMWTHCVREGLVAMLEGVQGNVCFRMNNLRKQRPLASWYHCSHDKGVLGKGF